MSSDAGPHAGVQPSSQSGASYVVSSSGHAAHPDSIIQSCHALQSHLLKLEQDAKATLEKWNMDIKERELAEKRRVAPGWLDVEQSGRGLMPDRKNDDIMIPAQGRQLQLPLRPAREAVNLSPRTAHSATPLDGVRDEGAELDRAFG